MQIRVGGSPEAANKGRAIERRPIAIDLFSGVGGFSLGFEQAGFDLAVAVEFDPIHAATYAFNFPTTEILCRDVTCLSAADLMAATRRWAARQPHLDSVEIDVVIGGTPCQGFSTGGKRNGADERNQLVFQFLRLVGELRPRFCVMENVPAMRSSVDPRHPDRTVLKALTEGLEDAGYAVRDPLVLNASHYGIPQERRRLVLLASRSGECLPAVPPPTVRPRLKRPGIGPAEDDNLGDLPCGPSVWDAIGDLPDIDRFDELSVNDSVQLSTEILAEMMAAASPYTIRLRDGIYEVTDLSHPRRWVHSLLTSSMRTNHSADAISRFASTLPGQSEPISRYYRLHPEGLSSTLRAGTGYERGSFMAPRPIHPLANRVISPREAARLHSFPDWFRFHRTKWHAFRQIGNSVPPLLARSIGQEIARAMGVMPFQATELLCLGEERLLSLATQEAALEFGARPDESPSHRLRLRARANA